MSMVSWFVASADLYLLFRADQKGCVELKSEKFGIFFKDIGTFCNVKDYQGPNGNDI